MLSFLKMPRIKFFSHEECAVDLFTDAGNKIEAQCKIIRGISPCAEIVVFSFFFYYQSTNTCFTDIPAEEPTAACDINHLIHLNVHRASPGLKLSGRAHEINERFVSVLGPFLRSTETLSKLMFSRAHETLGYFSIPDHGKVMRVFSKISPCKFFP